MSVFGTMSPRRQKAGSPWGDGDVDLAALTAQVPDLDRAVEEIDRAVEQAERQAAESERDPCSCW